MKDRLKKALKRGASGLLAVLLAVCLVGTPRAKAVVSEGALLGSIFGSLLVSMGFSWAADNFDAPSFGEAIYDLIKQCDEETDSGIQLLIDSNLAGLTAVGNGKLTFNQQWVRLANSFVEWFSQKFLPGSNTHILYPKNCLSFDYSSTSGSFTVYFPRSVNVDGSLTKNTTLAIKYIIPTSGSYTVVSNGNFNSALPYVSSFGMRIGDDYLKSLSGDGYVLSGNAGSWTWDITDENVNSGVYLEIGIKLGSGYSTLPVGTYSLQDNVLAYLGSVSSALTAEKPQEIHYPVVAEDGSQVYEITVDGVTATDIEGIIQGAVDRILAGTAAIVGSVEQAATGEEVVNPEIDPYKVSLSSVFPFCIPFDVYNMVTMFVAEPEAPNAEWTFTLPWSGQEYSVGWDLSDFDVVAQVCRSMELVLFAVGLAVITHKVIKW